MKAITITSLDTEREDYPPFKAADSNFPSSFLYKEYPFRKVMQLHIVCLCISILAIF